MIVPETMDVRRVCEKLNGTFKTQYPIEPTMKIIMNSRTKYCKNFFISINYLILSCKVYMHEIYLFCWPAIP